MLKSHMDAIENHLITVSKIPANSGHTLHKGTPREAFIKEYLEGHLPSNVAIGTGEIIDANSKPGEKRNQYDIVIYRSSYPKLDFGGGISGFLVESVVATIEVKSVLTQSEFATSASSAKNCKSLVPNIVQSFYAGDIPPSVLNYIVAYDGPASMKTVHGWIAKEYSNLNIGGLQLPLEAKQRKETAAEAIDAVFILGKGFLYFDNVSAGFADEEKRKANPNSNWVYSDTPSGNLLLLFSMIQRATSNIEGRWLDAIPYLSNFSIPGITMGA
jgi:hypothetical protein